MIKGESERHLAAKIDETIELANKLGSISQVVNDREKQMLVRWIVRWREVKRRLLREGIND